VIRALLVVLALAGTVLAQLCPPCPCSTTSTRSTTSTSSTTQPGGYNPIWSQKIGGTVLADSASVRGVGVDALWNTYATGFFTGTVNGGCGNRTSGNRMDLFVAKYSPTGQCEWWHRYGEAAATDQQAFALAVDPAGNVFVTGQYFGTAAMHFGGAPLPSQGVDAFLASYDTNGNHRWSKRLGGLSLEKGVALAADASGVYLTGQFADVVDFGTGPIRSAGSSDGFLARYTAAGVLEWVRPFGGASLDVPVGVCVSAGQVVVGGHFPGTATLAGVSLTSAGANDIFLAAYSTDGSPRWAKRFGDWQDQRAYGVACGAGIAITGYHYGTIDFGGTAHANVAGTAGDAYLAVLELTGAHRWSKSMGTTLASSGDLGKAVAFDSHGTVYLAAQIVGDVSLGAGPLVGGGTYDPALARYRATGEHLWSRRFVGLWDDDVHALVVGSRLAFGGHFAQAIDFGTGGLSSPGGSDGFVVDPES